VGGLRRQAFPAVALILLAVAAVGCGGGDSTSSSGSTEETVDWSLYPPGPTRQFIVPGKDNAVQTFGWEASAAEREEATREIAAWMRARAAKDLEKYCSYFSREYLRTFVKDAHRVSDGKVKTCPEAVPFFERKYGEEVAGDYRNTFGDGPVVSFRVNNTHGYAQYHGNDGRDWVVPMGKEDGEWKIANGTPFERFK
jgi:hypothetical protein